MGVASQTLNAKPRHYALKLSSSTTGPFVKAPLKLFKIELIYKAKKFKVPPFTIQVGPLNPKLSRP